MQGQIGAVTGIKKKPSYVDIINAETPYLPGLTQAKENREFADKTFAFNERQAEIDKDMAWDAAHTGRKQQNRATNLGIANLGLNVLSETGALGDLYDSIMGLF